MIECLRTSLLQWWRNLVSHNNGLISRRIFFSMFGILLFLMAAGMVSLYLHRGWTEEIPYLLPFSFWVLKFSPDLLTSFMETTISLLLTCQQEVLKLIISLIWMIFSSSRQATLNPSNSSWVISRTMVRHPGKNSTSIRASSLQLLILKREG